MLYEVEARIAAEILARLDHREQAGYMRIQVTPRTLAPSPGDRQPATCYIATSQNADYLGAAPVADMARQIATSHGPSGSGREYLLRLHQWLVTHDIDEPHIIDLVRALKAFEHDY